MPFCGCIFFISVVLLVISVEGASEQPSHPSVIVDNTKKIDGPESVETPQSAAAQDREELYELGLNYTHGTETLDRDLNAAAGYFNESSNLGHGGAQFMMALFYTNGLAVPKNEAKAVLYLHFAAMNGNTHAQLALANRHYYGYAVVKSCQTSVKYYRKVADKVARLYKDSGVLAHVEKTRLNDDGALQQRQTDEDIMQYYQYSADKGDTQSKMILGRAYMFGTRGVEQNAQMSEMYFNRAIEAGEAAGHGGLGQLYAQGVEGGPKPLARNYTRAAIHFKKGADLGHPVSQNGMGFLYMGGHGVPVNYTEAARYFRLAADLSNPEAQYNLGVLYLNGEGVPRDPMKALKYLQLASQQGQILAHYQLGNMYNDGTGMQQPNCLMAFKFYKAVCEKGAWNKRIGEAYDAYMNGDYTTAFLEYLIVAEEGYEIGQGNVAYMLDQQLGLDEIPREHIYAMTEPTLPPIPTTEDAAEDMNVNNENSTKPHSEKSTKEIYKERALVWYKRSAEQGNVESIIRIGDYYYYGWGIPVNFAKSVERYRDAGDRAHPQALFNLGYMHENGLSIPKDFHLAKRYYDQAATHSDKAWVPVQIALVHLHIRMWYDEYALNGDLMVYGYKIEDILLTVLVGLLTLLFYLRMQAVAAPPPQ